MATTKTKRSELEKLEDHVQYYKDKLDKWRNAITKAEGRKPNRNDLRSAPDYIQRAYDKFKKLSTHLESKRKTHVASPASSLSRTPHKIFEGGGHVKLRITPLVNNPPERPSGSRLFSSTGPCIQVTAGSKMSALAELSYNKFSEKIFNAVTVFQETAKQHKTLTVRDEETGKDVTRKVLIPNRVLTQKNEEVQEKGGNTSAALNKSTSDSSGNSSLFMADETDEVNPPAFSSTQAITKVNPCGVWQTLSPQTKSEQGRIGYMKCVDSGWLTRCSSKINVEDTENSEVPIPIPHLNLLEDVDEADSCCDTFKEAEGLFSKGFQNLLLSGSENKSLETPSSKEAEEPFSETLVNAQSYHSLSVDGASLDSGVEAGLTTIQLDVAQNMPNLVPGVEYTYSVPVNGGDSDVYLFENDNARSPPDSTFETIDCDALKEILSQPPQGSELACSKKRSAQVAFSPSPEKREVKRKFFKSRSTVSKVVAKYTVNSYKPPTPIKKKVLKVPAPVTQAIKYPEIPKPVELPKLVLVNSATSQDSQEKQKDIDEELKGEEIHESLNVSSHSISSNNISSSKDVVKPRVTTAAKKTEVKRSRTSKVGKNKKEPVNKSVETNHPSTSFNQVTASEYYDEVPTEPSTSRSRKGAKPKRVRLTNKQFLQSKIDNGRLNENFVRIDITKKVFVRGKKRMTGAAVKRNDWKSKKASASKEEKMKSFTCRKCGESGHFAKFCTKGLVPQEEPEEIDDSPFPTLQEAARMVKNQTGATRVNVYATNKDISFGDEETFENGLSEPSTSLCESVSNNTESILEYKSPPRVVIKTVPPYFGNEAGSLACSPDEEKVILLDTLKKLGYDDFRDGQYEAISRVMKGLTTLVILSTGSGKSLCYQLPAYLYAKKFPGALAICVSPLVSLMEDQVQGIPPFLEAACLHSNMSSVQKEKVLARIRSKKLHVLIVSPEAVCGGLFGLLRGVQDLPNISFACIDEVHCVSQWSHNFRPCYLQLSKILRERLNVTTILGLTATATATTAMNICEHLQVDPSSTIRGEIIPNNLNLSVSRDALRDEALLILLQGERFKECESIIIYCTRRDECERIAVLIRTNVQEIPGFGGITKTNLRQRVSNNCEAYHAGMTPTRRRLVQQQFMTGKIRIVVATVAFGMGIDKSNIRSVIHYNMPSSFESYVQEIGRAGRDGLPSHCHLFLDNSQGSDLKELRRHVYANSVDRPTIRKLLRKVFQPCKCKRISEISNNSDIQKIQETKRCPGHEVSFNIEETINQLDLPKENITTLLCYLELDKSKKWVDILSHTYETCKIHFYGGCKLIKSSALKCPPLAAAIALKTEQNTFNEKEPYIEFNVIEVSATLGWNSGIVKRELKNLEWTGIDADEKGNSTKFRKSGILVEFCDLAFHLNAPGDLTDDEADIILNYLHKHSLGQEKSQLYQLSRVYQALQCISFSNVDVPADGFSEEKSNMLKKFINDYFTRTSVGVPENWKSLVPDDENKRDEICRDIQDLICKHQDIQFTGRAVAKIFQGISSPCFPAEIWGRNRAVWRKYLGVDFSFLCQVASQEILRFS